MDNMDKFMAENGDKYAKDLISKDVLLVVNTIILSDKIDDISKMFKVKYFLLNWATVETVIAWLL